MKIKENNFSKKIVKKAEQYIRKNATYYGNNTFSLGVADWLYFINGLISEVRIYERKNIKRMINNPRKYTWIDMEGKQLIEEITRDLSK